MDLQAEKIELVKLLLETQKESLIKKIKTLLKESKEASFEPSNSQKEELDRRLIRINKEKTKFYTWQQVEQKLKEVL